MSNIQVMIVEDEEIFARTLKIFLEAHNYKISGMFKVGEEAIQQAENLMPDLILMDINLAGIIDGIETADKILQKIDIPIIYLTGHSDSKTLERAMITGPFGYIVKPFQAQDLYASIEITLYRHEMDVKLKASEEKYRLLVETSSDAIGIRQNGEYIFFNRAFSSILGYSDVELAALSFREIYTEKGLNMLAQGDIQPREDKNNLSRYESEIKKMDGSVIAVEVSSAKIEYKGHAASFEVLRDITEQKLLLKQLQDSVDKHKSLVGIIPICASCKKIRDDDKDSSPWIAPEVYISERLRDVKFSHAICPDCAKILYPDYVED